jgi:hypothetical protein
MTADALRISDSAMPGYLNLHGTSLVTLFALNAAFCVSPDGKNFNQVE